MMQPWFPDAKLGIFIHYGIYAVEGIPESWSLFSGQVTPEVYWSQCKGFTANKYNPEQWADLFVAAGAKYSVLTTKHHDGVALWNSPTAVRNTVNDTAAGKDLLTAWTQAIRDRGLKVGFYFSHLDWSHPDYPTILPKNSHYTNFDNRYAFPESGREKPEKWQKFLAFHRAQLDELCTQFGEIDLLWFDGDWERDPEQWDFKELRDRLTSHQPNVIFNSRMLGYGDYSTPEQGQPVTPPEGHWEFCMTINDSWGFQKNDFNEKSVKRLIRIFAETISAGGNLLLDVGPTAEGEITPAQTERLLGLGRWVHKHAEAIYGTVAGLPGGLFYGPTTLSKDKQTLYAMSLDIPRESVIVRGLSNKVKRVSVVGTNQELAFKKVTMAEWMGVPSDLEIVIPDDFAPDQDCTVFKIELQQPLSLQLTHGRS
jgi:alpha-L-fucosidase